MNENLVKISRQIFFERYFNLGFKFEDYSNVLRFFILFVMQQIVQLKEVDYILVIMF